METIQKYLELLFEAYPKTVELFLLKEEISMNMEERYYDLKSEGMSENEIIGTVISEFSNIKELLHEHNIPSRRLENSLLPEVTLEKANQYIKNKKSIAILIGIGVLLCVLAPAVLIAMTTFLPSDSASQIGVVSLLVIIAIAVGMFIFSSFLKRPWIYIEIDSFRINPSILLEIRRRQEQGYLTRTLFLIIAVILYILGPAVIILSSTLTETENSSSLSVIILLCMIAIATMILIISDAKNSAYNALLQRELSGFGTKQTWTMIGAIAAFWWPVTLAVFLSIGFFTKEGFNTAWMVWPLSSALFGAIAGVISIISKRK